MLTKSHVERVNKAEIFFLLFLVERSTGQSIFSGVSYSQGKLEGCKVGVYVT